MGNASRPATDRMEPCVVETASAPLSFQWTACKATGQALAIKNIHNFPLMNSIPRRDALKTLGLSAAALAASSAILGAAPETAPSG